MAAAGLGAGFERERQNSSKIQRLKNININIMTDCSQESLLAFDGYDGSIKQQILKKREKRVQQQIMCNSINIFKSMKNYSFNNLKGCSNLVFL